MKKTGITGALLLIIMVAGMGCKKIVSNIFKGFETTLPKMVVTIPSFTVLPGTPVPDEEIALPVFSQKFNLDSLIKANTNGVFGVDDLNSVKLTKMKISIENADQNNNLANFKTLRFALSSNNNNTPVEVATFTFDDSYAETKTYTAPNGGPELINYLKGSQLNYHSHVRIRRFTTKPLRISFETTIRTN